MGSDMYGKYDRIFCNYIACGRECACSSTFFRHRQKQVMDGLSDMLEAAINGTFSETTFNESRQSSLENRLAQYLAASELSVRSIDVEREKIKELIADISHQTRTPLSNILLYTELLEEEPLGKQHRIP